MFYSFNMAARHVLYKLLMQWKDPFEVSSVVGLNDYRVKVKEKENVYHANLHKKYFERDEATTEGAVAVVKAEDHFKEDKHCKIEECEVKDAEDDGNVDFLEISGYDAKESVADVTTGSYLTDEQRFEFMNLANQFSSLFTEAPSTTDLVQHHIKLTSDEPVR